MTLGGKLMARTRAEQKLYDLGYVDQNENDWYCIYTNGCYQPLIRLRIYKEQNTYSVEIDGNAKRISPQEHLAISQRLDELGYL